MDGLSFIAAAPPVGSDPARADIACFVGFVTRRPVRERLAGESDAEYLERLPAGLRGWLHERGWRANEAGRTAENLVDLENVPVPIDTWDAFDALFAWDQREISETTTRKCDSALGAAVRSFFEKGGRKCYVVRLGDPWPVLAAAEDRDADASSFLPLLPPPSPADRESWRGVAHLFGLPDVSFLCTPDLPELFAARPVPQPPAGPPLNPEVFVECAEPQQLPPQRESAGLSSPRCDQEGFEQWSHLVAGIGGFLRRFAREVQFIAAIPLPADAASLAGHPNIASRIHDAQTAQWEQAALIATAFVQLVYPWLRTKTSRLLPGGLEAPDASLAGVLANSALARNSWRSAIRQPVAGIVGVEPVLDRATLGRDFTPSGSRYSPVMLRERVTVIGPSPGGFLLVSDVTTDDDPAYRPANVNRLVNAIIRAARVSGETAVFQNNGEALWTRLRENLDDLLAALWSDGALNGAFAEEAYEVRCDRSTMTQGDLDAGRVICRVSFSAASPIVHVTVVFAMDEGGQLSLASRPAFQKLQSQAA